MGTHARYVRALVTGMTFKQFGESEAARAKQNGNKKAGSRKMAKAAYLQATGKPAPNAGALNRKMSSRTGTDKSRKK